MSRDETIFGFGRITAETARGYHEENNGGASPVTEPGDESMRALSFLLACGFVLAGSSLAGTPDGNLPGIGTFRYSGSPVAASQPVVLAARF